MPHALVVGGTGMLAGLCLALASDGRTVSVVARRHARLASLAHRAAGLAGRINPISVDYADSAEVVAHLRAALVAWGPVDLAVCWIHSGAPGASVALAQTVADRRTPCRYFQILGSEAHAPGAAADNELGSIPGILLRQVVLGFVLEPPGPRWLTDLEICCGALDAIERDAPESVVGTVRPWAARPPFRA